MSKFCHGYVPRLQNKLFLECGQVTQPQKHVEILPWLRASPPKQVVFEVWSGDPASKTCRNFAMATCLASKTSCFWSVVRCQSAKTDGKLTIVIVTGQKSPETCQVCSPPSRNK